MTTGRYGSILAAVATVALRAGASTAGSWSPPRPRGPGLGRPGPIRGGPGRRPVGVRRVAGVPGRRPGLRTAGRAGPVQAQWYEYPPIDLFAEVLWPFRSRTSGGSTWSSSRPSRSTSSTHRRGRRLPGEGPDPAAVNHPGPQAGRPGPADPAGPDGPAAGPDPVQPGARKRCPCQGPGRRAARGSRWRLSSRNANPARQKYRPTADGLSRPGGFARRLPGPAGGGTTGTRSPTPPRAGRVPDPPPVPGIGGRRGAAPLPAWPPTAPGKPRRTAFGVSTYSFWQFKNAPPPGRRPVRRPGRRDGVRRGRVLHRQMTDESPGPPSRRSSGGRSSTA
jgi:hypothetical protein